VKKICNSKTKNGIVKMSKVSKLTPEEYRAQRTAIQRTYRNKLKAPPDTTIQYFSIVHTDTGLIINGPFATLNKANKHRRSVIKKMIKVSENFYHVPE
jgi:hypothetical protein